MQLDSILSPFFDSNHIISSNSFYCQPYIDDDRNSSSYNFEYPLFSILPFTHLVGCCLLPLFELSFLNASSFVLFCIYPCYCGNVKWEIWFSSIYRTKLHRHSIPVYAVTHFSDLKSYMIYSVNVILIEKYIPVFIYIFAKHLIHGQFL